MSPNGPSPRDQGAAGPAAGTPGAAAHHEGLVGTRRGAWWLPAVAGATAFWLANLAVSLTHVAADYRSALSIAYVPMLVEAAVGGLVISSLVTFLLARFGDHVPGHTQLAKALALTVAAVVLLTVVLGIPSVLRPGVDHRGHWLLVGLVLNTLRILALGATVGLVTRARTTRPDSAAGAARQGARP